MHKKNALWWISTFNRVFGLPTNFPQNIQNEEYMNISIKKLINQELNNEILKTKYTFRKKNTLFSKESLKKIISQSYTHLKITLKNWKCSIRDSSIFLIM